MFPNTYGMPVVEFVEGEFSSKSKAESLKKQLKASGDKARIYAVFA